jgi:molybdopterin converting factor small subunit
MPDTVTVVLPNALLRLFPGAPRQSDVTASTVAEAVAALDRQWPGMADRLCDSTPAIRRHLAIFVDGERASLHTAIRPAAEVIVMTAISGG